MQTYLEREKAGKCFLEMLSGKLHLEMWGSGQQGIRGKNYKKV